MPRLIRIACTLFASATILILLVYSKLTSLRSAIDGGMPSDYIENESSMVTLGFGLAGFFIIIGIFLIIAYFLGRKKKDAP